jgi:para-nitrobenzyl esterase
MAKRVHAYWVAFAKTGRPGDAGGIAWPAFTAEKQDLLQFGGEGLTLRSHFLDPQLDAVAPAAAAPSR